MLTGKQVRVRFARDKIAPVYLKTDDPQWLDWAETLLAMFRNAIGRTQGELDEELDESFAAVPQPVVPQGLAKLLEDRCEFETKAEHPPEEVREAVFLAAAARRLGFQPDGIAADGQVENLTYDRDVILTVVQPDKVPAAVGGGEAEDAGDEEVAEAPDEAPEA